MPSVRTHGRSPSVAPRDRRLDPKVLGALVLIAAIPLGVFLVDPLQPLLEHHSFRQTQTALTSFWMLHGGGFFAYLTPVLGAPWTVPMEFPLFQAIVAFVVRVGGLPLDVSFTAGALGLKLDAWGLLKGRADLSSLQAVQVEDPRVYILRSGVPSEGRPPAAEPASPTGAASPGNAASSGKAASSGNAASPGAAGRAPATASVDLGAEEWRSNLQRLPVPAVRITIHHGAAWDQAGGRAPSLLADGVSLLVEPSEDGGWRLTASGRPAGQGSANVTGRCGPSFSGLEAELRFTEVTWPSWLETPAGLPAPQGHVSGELEARAVRGAWPAP